jgi:hypothetical protein
LRFSVFFSNPARTKVCFIDAAQTRTSVRRVSRLALNRYGELKMNAKKLIASAAVLSAFAGSAFAADIAPLEGPNAVVSAPVATQGATRAEIRAQAAEAQAKGLIGTGEYFPIHKADPAPARTTVNDGPVNAGSGFAYVLG